MTVKLLTEHNLEFLCLKGGCTGSSESTLVKMPHCWKSYVRVQFSYILMAIFFQLTLEDVSKSKVYEFAANVWIRMDDYNDFWRELPVKKETDQLPGESRSITLYAWLMFDTHWHVLTKTHL